MNDLRQAIQYAQEAVLAMTQEDLDRPKFMSNLVAHLNNKYNQTGGISDLEQVIEHAPQGFRTLFLNYLHSPTSWIA